MDDLDLGQTIRGFAPGQRLFNRYKLLRILGRGGMGVVWLARDEELERDVALKFLPELLLHDRAVLGSLKRETCRCLELTHAHIVRIYDFVQSDESACISMEYVDGDTLSNMRFDNERGVFGIEEIEPYVQQICEALDYAHTQARIVHRDLKPANLMVNKKGEVKITDFGIARSLTDSVSMLTMNRGSSGTLLYMSPQQLDGEAVSHLDDIYSLGATLYELLTSKPPFYRGGIEHLIREKVPPTINARRHELGIATQQAVPGTWERTIAACLAKDPAARPQSIAEFGSGLGLFQVARHRITLATSSPDHVQHEARTARSAPRAAIVAAAAALAVGSVVGTWLLAHRFGAERDGAPKVEEAKSVLRNTPNLAQPSLIASASPSPVISHSSSTIPTPTFSIEPTSSPTPAVAVGSVVGTWLLAHRFAAERDGAPKVAEAKSFSSSTTPAPTFSVEPISSPTPAVASSYPSVAPNPFAAAASQPSENQKIASAASPGVVVSVPLTRPLEIREGDIIRQMVVQHTNAGANGDVDSMMSLYADKVDFLEEGFKPRDEIAKDVPKYNAHWPIRRSEIAGDVHIDPLNDTERRVRYTLEYDAQNPATREAYGSTVDVTWVVQRDASGDFKIISHKQKGTRRAPRFAGESPATTNSSVAQQIRNFVNEHIQKMMRSDCGAVVTDYTENPDYFEYGRVGRAFIAKDCSSYVKSWPSVSFKFTSGINVTEGSNGEHFVSFGCDYEAKNPQRRKISRGHAEDEWTVVEDASGFKIAKHRETVTNRVISN